MLAGIVRRKQGMEARVPFAHEVQTAFLHPTIEVVRSDLVRRIQNGTLRIEDLDGRLLHADTLSAVSRRIWSVMTGIESVYVGVVL